MTISKSRSQGSKPDYAYQKVGSDICSEHNRSCTIALPPCTTASDLSRDGDVVESKNRNQPQEPLRADEAMCWSRGPRILLDDLPSLRFAFPIHGAAGSYATGSYAAVSYFDRRHRRCPQAGPAVATFDEQVNESRAQVRQARLGPNPRLFLQSEDLRPWSSQFSFTTQTEMASCSRGELDPRTGASSDVARQTSHRESGRELIVQADLPTCWCPRTW